jgi:hypothetical protein
MRNPLQFRTQRANTVRDYDIVMLVSHEARVMVWTAYEVLAVWHDDSDPNFMQIELRGYPQNDGILRCRKSKPLLVRQLPRSVGRAA